MINCGLISFFLSRTRHLTHSARPRWLIVAGMTPRTARLLRAGWIIVGLLTTVPHWHLVGPQSAQALVDDLGTRIVFRTLQVAPDAQHVVDALGDVG